jgi:hypothetical protein
LSVGSFEVLKMVRESTVSIKRRKAARSFHNHYLSQHFFNIISLPKITKNQKCTQKLNKIIKKKTRKLE